MPKDPSVPAWFCPTAQTSVLLTINADHNGPAFGLILIRIQLPEFSK